MRNLLWITALIILGCSSPQESVNKELAIVISIDQVGSEYFEKMMAEDQFSGGFKRLTELGVYFPNTLHNHSCTNTAVGHASIATGCHPMHHGITGNWIYNKQLDRMEYAIVDSSSILEGVDSCSLRPVSHARLERTSWGDILRSTHGGKSFSVSMKDRTAVLMGGKDADRAFWFDKASTQMVSTTTYSEPFPEWARQYPASEVLSHRLSEGWKYSGHRKEYPSGDSFNREGDVFYAYFPHDLKSIHNTDSATRPGDYFWNTPYGDEYVLAFSKRLITHYRLGSNNTIDALSIGLSSCDYIGHQFGPDSYETEDYLLRIDLWLGEFMQFLDQEIGNENYTLVLTSDHGTCPIPERSGHHERRIPYATFKQDILVISAALASELGIDGSAVEYYRSRDVEPNFDILDEAGIDSLTLVQMICEKLEALPYIDATYHGFELRSGEMKDAFAMQYQHNYHPKNSMFIGVRHPAYYLITSYENGTDHGSPYSYDAMVPCMFYGFGHKACKQRDTIESIDIAPTILSYYGASLPEMDGKDVF